MAREILQTSLGVGSDNSKILLRLPFQHRLENWSERRLLDTILFAKHDIATTPQICLEELAV
jgi:hypothetical protein